MKQDPDATPFDDFRQLVAELPGPDDAAMAAFDARDGVLTKPPGALGRMEDIARWLAGWQARHPARIDNAVAAVFAGNHGVVNQNISAFPSEVTGQMVANFQSGGAAINQICKTFGIGLKVFELALDIPTGDITTGPALDEVACAATMAFGMEAIAGDTDLLCIGEMGIGNTTIAAALCTGLFGGDGADWVGPGTGVDDEGVARKADAVNRAVGLHAASLNDPLMVLACLGGREQAAMCGAILAARLQNIPVLIDGFVATASAAVLHKMSPSALDHCMIAHCSAEPAHKALIAKLGKTALLDLGMRLGEASGAALAAGLVKAAASLHSGMATFDGAGVSGKTDEDT